jgi:hypothetical protein
MRVGILVRSSARRCAGQERRTALQVPRRLSTKSEGTARGFEQKRRGRRLQAAAVGGFVLAAPAVYFSNDVKHGYDAVARSTRVLSTLAVCVNE